MLVAPSPSMARPQRVGGSLALAAPTVVIAGALRERPSGPLTMEVT
jgi:hypothetical protein